MTWTLKDYEQVVQRLRIKAHIVLALIFDLKMKKNLYNLYKPLHPFATSGGKLTHRYCPKVLINSSELSFSLFVRRQVVYVELKKD